MSLSLCGTTREEQALAEIGRTCISPGAAGALVGLFLLLSLAGRSLARLLHFPDLGVLAVALPLALAGVGCWIFAYPRILGGDSLWLVRRLLAKANPAHGWVRRFAAVPDGE